MRADICASVCVSTLLFCSFAHAETELKNDGFASGDTAACQGGFAVGDIGASRFVAPSSGATLVKLQLLYAPAVTQMNTRTVTVKVWDDTASTVQPGAELFNNDFQLTGANDAIQEIVLPGGAVVPPLFRVGMVFHDAGSPAICADVDGSIAADKNYIFDTGTPPIPGQGWVQSQDLGVSGDWILRAFVSGDGAPGDAGATGGACNSNPDCPSGQFCDTAAHACTFECRIDDDCNGGTCNSLGQCVGSGGGGGGGCCQTDRGNGTGAFALAALVGLVVRRRRRR